MLVVEGKGVCMWWWCVCTCVCVCWWYVCSVCVLVVCEGLRVKMVCVCIGGRG